MSAVVCVTGSNKSLYGYAYMYTRAGSFFTSNLLRSVVELWIAMERFTNVVGAAAFLASVGVVSYVAVTRSGDASTTALGAVIALLSAGAGYFLRGRVQGTNTNTNNDSAGASGSAEGNVLLRAEGPATATVRSESGLSAGGAAVTSEK